MSNEFLFLVQISSCLLMTGIIWVIQCVHYPAFKFVDNNSFSEFHRFHSAQITWIVAPLMAAEIFSAFFIVLRYPNTIWWVNFGSIVVLWLCTGCVSVPIHNRLGKECSPLFMQRLCLTNWPRTLIWTARSVFLILCLRQWLIVRL